MINQTIMLFWEKQGYVFIVFGNRWHAKKIDPAFNFLAFETCYDPDGNLNVIYYYDKKPYTETEMLRIINNLKVFV